MKRFTRDRQNGSSLEEPNDSGLVELTPVDPITIAKAAEEEEEEHGDDIKVMAGENLVNMDLALSAWQRYIQKLKKGG